MTRTDMKMRERIQDLQNETEDAASASTSATSTPWSVILVVVVVIHFITLSIAVCGREQGGHQPLTTSKERFSKELKKDSLMRMIFLAKASGHP